MIDVSHRGRVAILTLAHGKANALDTELCQGLAAHFAALRDSATHAIVLTAQGRIFSAGVDLLRAVDAGPDYFRSFLPALSALYETVFFYPKPVIAAVNGHAVAGGCVLACAADWRVMASGARRIGVTELLVGLPFPALAFEIMRFASAPERFADIILGAGTFPPEEAVRLGLVDECVAPEELMKRALARAERLAGLRPAAFELSKRQIRQPVLERFRADGQRIDAAVTEAWTAPEAFASIRDYVSRTFKKP
jgi:enoyl-CoA hydratase